MTSSMRESRGRSWSSNRRFRYRRRCLQIVTGRQIYCEEIYDATPRRQKEKEEREAK
jgi:hypothetical protein